MQSKKFAALLAKSAVLLTLFHGCRCRSSKCPAPTPPPNGDVVYRNSESSYVMYKCDPGYVLLGSRSSLCMLGRWSPDTPSCVHAKEQGSTVFKIPVLVGELSSAAPQPSITSTPWPFHEKKDNGTEVRKRSASRHNQLAARVDRSCSLPPLFSKGYIIVSRFSPNEVRYVCERGYTLSKQRIMYCENGTWSEPPPQCLDANGQAPPLEARLAEMENLCERNFGGCEQLCYFGGRTKSCGCAHGYSYNGTRCQDINECETRKPDCQYQCVNTPGSFHCACPAGFEVSRDERSCIVQAQRYPNYCLLNNGGCSHVCRSGMRGAICDCPNGYKLSQNRKTCEVQAQEYPNYCLLNNGGCSHGCRSGMHGAICNCPNGYKLSQNGKTCKAQAHVFPNNCSFNNGGCSHECRSGMRGTMCGCPNGYKLSEDGKTCEDINECSVNRGGCMELCWNTIGSFRCGCATWGFDLTADGKTCVPQKSGIRNFCGHNKGGCSHICRSSEHQAVCDCPNGYELSQDNKTCTDIDECYYGHAKCQHRCINTPGSYECKCRPGYTISADNKEHCTDINECETNNFGCTHVCVNVPGSARCYCKPGFRLEGDGKSCADVDECASLKSKKKCRYGCRNTEGGYECFKNNTDSVDRSFPPEDEEEGSGYGDEPLFDYEEENFLPLKNDICPEGYVGSAHQCRDIDECSNGAHNCTGRCVNTPGGFYCACPPWLSLDEDGTSCSECPVDTYKHRASDRCEKCPPNSHTTGSGKVSVNDCVCNPGYRKDPYNSGHCQDINECISGRHRCPERCVNTPGSFHCSCNPGRIRHDYQCQDCPAGTYKNEEFNQCERCPAHSHTLRRASTSKKDCICDRGYRGDPGSGVPCEDINECEEKTLLCSHECVNIFGSAFCSCPLGQRLKPDNLTCGDIDECTENPRICSQLCTNTHGSYVCSCNPGYTLSTNDSYQCIDNDECATRNHGCSHTCVNFDGGYYCKCPEGFQMTADLRTCANITCPMFIDVPNSVTKCSRTSVDSSVPIGTRCAIHCNAGFELEGHAATVCSKNGTWAAELPTCKPLHCPPIPRPQHGDVLPERCLQSNANYFKSRCYFQCDEGYKLRGHPVTTCQKNNNANPRGQAKDTALAWNRKPASCEKETPRIWITCPPSTTFVLPPGQSSMQPDIPLPNTNVDQENVKLDVNDLYNGTLPYGDTKMTYIATRPETNESARCTFEVTVEDKEPPQVLRCPTTVSAVATSLEGVTVTWKEPEFFDNVEVDTVEKSKEPGSLFNTGLHIVYYTARDTAGNEAVCKFQVNVTRNECRLPADIEHGSTECHPWLQGVVCEPSCDDGYALPNNVSLFYTCDLAGVWEPRSWIPHCQAYTPSPSTGCLPGSEYFDELNGETNVCVECPPGMYWAQDVAQCFLCEQGFYQDQPAQSSCKPCPANATEVSVLSPLLEQQCFS